MPGRPRRSCDSCNAQKVRIHSNLIPEWSSFGGIVQLRCCGQKPSCQRCTRIGRSCIYTGSSTTPRRRRRSASVVSVLPAQRPHSASLASPPLPRHIPGKRYSGIPSALLPTLIDLYFSHVYNSNLTVHKPTFLQALEADDVRLDIVLSICALAAMYDLQENFYRNGTTDLVNRFHKDANGSAVLVENQFCREWAEEAGRIALSQIETPCSDNVVVFLNLSLFWYSIGEFHRASMHGGTCWLMLLSGWLF